MSYGKELKLLVSGFGPFDSFGRNPSADIVRSVDQKRAYAVQVEGVVLDVMWKEGWQQLRSAIEAVRPDAVLMLGLGEDPTIRLEAIARNRTIPHADIRQRFPDPSLQHQIVPEGPAAYFSTLPLDWLLRKMQVTGVKSTISMGTNSPRIYSRISQDAGAYLCNYVFYQAKHHFRDQISCIGFVHVPSYNIFSEIFDNSDIVDGGCYLVLQLMSWLRSKESLVRPVADVL